MMRQQGNLRGINLAIKILIIILIVIAGLYLAGTAYFAKHFYQNGSVFGIELMNKTADQVKAEVQAKVDTYSIDIATRDGNRTLSATDFGMRHDKSDEIDAILDAQNPFLWVLMKWTSNEDIPIDVTWDNDTLREAIFKIDCFKDTAMKAPKDAYLDFKGNKYVVVPEEMGNKVDKDRTYERILEAIQLGESSVELDTKLNSCYYYPKIYSDYEPLVTECEGLNKILNMTITYEFGDRQEVLDGMTLNSWLKLNDDYTYELVESNLKDFIYDLAYKYDTFSLKRTFQTSLGTTVELSGGDYGWCIQQKQSVDALKEIILAGESVTTEPVYLYSGTERGSNDIGNSYVEVSIEAQTMWVYSNGQCVVMTPVVTGNEATKHGTPSGGVWAVDARIDNYNLVGQGYDTEVAYWLPFNEDVGIHDAEWRFEFGGEIYKTAGSHGCVNTPPDQMAIVYQYVQIGWPVVVY